MKIESIVFTSMLLLAGSYSEAAGQFVYSDQNGGAIVLLSQVIPAAPPAPPAAPGAPAPPTPPAMADLIRLMSSNGSYLGVGVRDVDAERKKVLNLKEERGAEITSVEDESPAAKAGLKTGDVVLDYASNRVESIEQFIRLVRETPAGREVKIVVSRGGNNTTLTAKPENGRTRLAGRIQIAPIAPIEVRELITRMDSPRPAMYWASGQLGIEAESLESQMAEFFGVKQGVLVRSVGKDTPAEKAGIKAGDVIVKVEDTKVGSAREVTSAIRAARGSSKTVALTVVREKKESALKVTFDEQPAGPGVAIPRSRSVGNKMQEF